ncbi:MAG: hypothetical protein J7497_03240, partial [Chitinophagaceae bacterium]|nr:hypothetical protein [Chitinophagaceae bacterium]
MKNIIILFVICVRAASLYAQVPENIYLHTDKSCYHAGEIIWMKADVINGKSGKPLSVSKVAYAELLDASNKPLLQGKIGLKEASGNGYFDIPQNFAAGKYILRAYTNWMKNFSPDYYFSKEITILNINDSNRIVPVARLTQQLHSNLRIAPLDINVSSNKNTYHTRDKITLDISSQAAAKLSVSVYRIDSLQQQDNTDIRKSLSHSLTSLPLDMPGFAYVPEYYGHIIKGKVIDTRTGKPAAGITGYMSVAGLQQFFQSSVSDAEGNISFDQRDFYGVNEIVLQTNSLTDTNYIIEIDNPFSTQYAKPVIDSLNISTVNANDRIRQGVSAQVQQAYFADMRNKYSFDELDTLAFYGTADANYTISDYTKFTSVEDILREYVTQVGVQKRNGKLFPFVYDRLRRKGFTVAPLYLVNDMPVFNIDRFMAMDPNVIKRIEVVDWRYFRAKNSYDGVVSLTTKNLSIDDFDMEKNAIVINYDGLQPERAFFSPVYATEAERNDRMPDFRNVLYWSPEVVTVPGNKKTIEFYSSDLKG